MIIPQKDYEELPSGKFRELPPEEYTCDFCKKPTTGAGAQWQVPGPELNICNGCTDTAAEVFGKLLGDLLFSRWGAKTSTTSVDEILTRVEGGAYRALYANAQCAVTNARSQHLLEEGR